MLPPFRLFVAIALVGQLFRSAESQTCGNLIKSVTFEG